MSGGHFDYKQYQIEDIAQEIEDIKELSRKIDVLQKSIDETLANVKELKDILLVPELGEAEKEMLDCERSQ